MREFKVVKKWPGGPEIGETLVQSDLNAYQKFAYQQDGRGNGWEVGQLEGFVEEVKQEEFWFLMHNGEVENSEGITTCPPWLRFRTKESAEKFAKALKASHNKNLFLKQNEAVMADIEVALNDRVK